VRIATALLYAIASAVLSAVGMAFAAGHLTQRLAVAALAIGAVVGTYSLWSERERPREAWKIDPIGGAALIVFALFALRCFLWLAFESGDQLWVFSPNNLGDLALHLTYVRLLANGAPFWPENPIFAGAPLTYPVGMDLLNSLLALVGVDVIRGLIAVGLVASACTMAALWRWGRGFAVAGFLFAGGLFGFAFFGRWEWIDYQSDAAYENLIVAWKSLPLALFVTQRGLLYALPAGLMLLSSWRSRFLEEDKSEQRLPLRGEILLYAAMPLFHLHTFLFLSLIAAWWFLAIPSARRHLLLVIGMAFLPATALVWCITGGLSGASMLGLQPGWMQDSPGYPNAVMFWLLNFGALPFLVGWLLVKMVRTGGSNSAMHIVFPALFVFLTCCVVKFAPWEWDNTKLMIWSYLAILPVIWNELLKRQSGWVRAAVCVLLFGSGAISLFGGMAGHSVNANDTAELRAQDEKPQIGYPVAVRSEMVAVTEATRGISITDRFIGHPNYNHPVLLTGHLLVMGYEGHAWSHGLDYRARLETVKSILRGEEGWRENAEKFGVRWLFWGKQEEDAYPESTEPWRETCRLHASGPWGELYDLTQPAVPRVQ
jgi:hypothetical protein